MNKILEDTQYLAQLNPTSEAAGVWRDSLVEDLVERGYSRNRAEQVIDDLTERARRH